MKNFDTYMIRRFVSKSADFFWSYLSGCGSVSTQAPSENFKKQQPLTSTNQLAHTVPARHAGRLLGRRSGFCCLLLVVVFRRCLCIVINASQIFKTLHHDTRIELTLECLKNESYLINKLISLVGLIYSLLQTASDKHASMYR